MLRSIIAGEAIQISKSASGEKHTLVSVWEEHELQEGKQGVQGHLAMLQLSRMCRYLSVPSVIACQHCCCSQPCFLFNVAFSYGCKLVT